MNVKSYPLFAGVVFAIASFSFPSRVNAQIPPTYVPDVTSLRNGGMALELCKRYLYQASANPNSLELQRMALVCQNVQVEYVQCIIQTRPEQGLRCMEKASLYLNDLLQYTPYLQ